MKMQQWFMVLIATLVLPASVAFAQPAVAGVQPEAVPDNPALTEPFFIAVGVYYPRSATNALLGPSGGGTGVGIDFEDTLGLSEREATLNLMARWRFGEQDHWRVELEYFDLKRSATRTLSEQVEWGDQIYAAGSVVDSTFNITDTRLTVGYSFFKRKDKELGVGLGLHMTKFEASLNASGVGQSSSNVTAPLPVVNFYGLFALTDRWALTMRYDWLSLSYGDYSGDIRSIALDFLYQPFENIGFGIGSRSLTIDVEIDSPDWHGTANLLYQGPTAFMTYSF